MPVVATLRHLRHGPLERLGPVWTALGDLYRTGLTVTGASRPTAHRIGGYGPFLLHGEFAFSDFEHWGWGHNRGFALCIEACRGKRCIVDVGAHIGLVTPPTSSPGSSMISATTAAMSTATRSRASASTSTF